MAGVELTDEEWEEFFGDDAAVEERPPRRWVRVFGIFVAVAMLATGASAAFGLWRDRNLIRNPESIRAAALDSVEASEYGDLVTDVVIEAIARPDVGAYVHASPADGVIHIAQQGWQPNDLRETVAHEIGHLQDFAFYDGVELPEGVERRGGIQSEAWAECAAVAAGERELDREGTTETYRCTPSEFAIHEAEVARITG